MGTIVCGAGVCGAVCMGAGVAEARGLSGDAISLIGSTVEGAAGLGSGLDKVNGGRTGGCMGLGGVGSMGSMKAMLSSMAS